MRRLIDIHDAQRQFLDAMRSHHLALNSNETLIADGHFRRCNAVNKEGHRGRNDGSYILHLSNHGAYGGFRNFTTSKEFIKWHYQSSRPLSAEEREQLDRVYQEHMAALKAERLQAEADGRKEAKALW